MDGPEETGASISTRSFPQLYNALFVGDLTNDPNSVSSDDLSEGMLRLREATGGEFGNMIVVNVATRGVFQDECFDEQRRQGTTPPTDVDAPDYLWISSNTIFQGATGFDS
eukprot:1455798-Prorocentrum_lima.AAC.1